ncbi:nitrate assimilation regulatory protein nirA [Fusarium flagelliforme]|uniref:nitrate assimilation regulatory protein nirA n=1 Tax=Fusarium flagelliforme TaxID=2675880 RepID=UPI001E8D2692|nr:nitrate assimilation regulatory protein nirA [Fusarium flagelliforme]KAH7191735.1 nitrate assimilation regulatory protein nirA [Fusarium flagelliforme]
MPMQTNPEQSTSSRGLRQLLPRGSGPPAQVGIAQNRELPRKRRPIAVACDSCRRHKLKCDGTRPRCGVCQTKNRECAYQGPPSETLKRKQAELEASHAGLEEVMSAIQRRPEAEAKAIFDRIRAGADAQSILRQIRHGDILLQLHLEPETRYRYEFPYKSQFPEVLSAVNNPYLGSLLYEGARVGASDTNLTLSSADEKYQAQYLRPYHAARIIDSRFDEVKPSQWTNVPVDDVFMRELLHLYFLHEFDSLPLFHKDYFLDGMLALDGRFCSPLLVNAVLTHASNSYAANPDRAQYWNPRNITYQFFAETKRLWELERLREPSLTTLQAALVITLVLNMGGLDKLGMTYLIQGAAMAHELGLFDSPGTVRDTKLRNARDFTAWGLFYLQSIGCYYFMIPPMIKPPTKISLPDVEEFPERYSEIWIKYPLIQARVPMRLGHTVRARTEFSIIMNTAAAARYDREDGSGPITPREISGFITDLKRWYERLPAPLLPKNVIFPSQLKLHMFYHYMLIGLYELLLTEVDIESSPDSVHTNAESQKLALDHSKVCLETLVRLYYLRHGFNGSDALLTNFLVIVAFQSISKLKVGIPSPSSSSSSSNPSITTAPSAAPDLNDARATLILAEKGLGEQGQSYFFAQTVFHVVLNSMSPEDAQLVEHYTKVPSEGPDERRMRAEHVHSDFPLEIVTATNSATSRSLNKLTKRYAEMTLEQANAEYPAEGQEQNVGNK